MSDMGISPEDRERLAKSKFGEWFDEFWDKKFGEEWEKRVATARQQRGNPPAPPQGPIGTQDGQQQQQPARRRSLLEECFSSTFGF